MIVFIEFYEQQWCQIYYFLSQIITKKWQVTLNLMQNSK